MPKMESFELIDNFFQIVVLLCAAAAAGIVAGDADKELEVLCAVTEDDLKKMADFLEKTPIHVERSGKPYLFDIQVRLFGGGHTAFAEIAGHHTNVIALQRDGEVLLQKEYVEQTSTQATDHTLLNVEQIVQFADEADLNDVNMIDPFHLEAYGKTTVNYNRDVEIFPVVNAMFELIAGKSPYRSPTDMGVNMAGNCIIDDEVCQEASRQEIIRRYYKSMDALVSGSGTENEVRKIELLLQQAHAEITDRKVVPAALEKEKETNGPAAAMELPDGRIVCGKTSDLLGASAALLLNALKELAGVDHEQHVISPDAIHPIQQLKTKYLGSKNPRLHIDEILIALSMSAATSDAARLALEQIPNLRGCQAHTSVMLSDVDVISFRKLGIELTCEAKAEQKKKYQKD